MAPPGEKNEGETSVDAKAQQKLERLKSLRTTTKSSMTRIQRVITKKGASLDTEELNCRLEMLEDGFKKISTVLDEIDQLTASEDASENETVTIEIEDMYVATKTKIMGLLSKRRTTVGDVSILNTTAAGSVARARREVKLPRFEGKYSDFPNFISLFTKLIHQDESFDNCERFLILKEHLGSKPLSAIDDFDVTDENYSKALARLKECYDKKVLMFEEHIAALFSLPQSSKTCSTHLRNVINSVNAHLSAMLSLGDYKAIANAMVIHIAMKSVDVDTQVKWEENVDYSKLSTWEECSSILTRRCENLEARESKLKQEDNKNTNHHKTNSCKRYNPTTLAIAKSSCAHCGGNGHWLAQCYQFKKLTIQDRNNAVRKANLCYKCLKKGHSFRDCTASNCGKCNLPHHLLLHKEVAREIPNQTPECAPSTSTQLTIQNSVEGGNSVLNVVAKPEVLLATAVVWIRDNCGKYHRARAVLDAGAQVNLMCENLAQKLLLKKRVCNLEASLAGEVSTCFKRETTTTIKSCFNEFEACLEFYVLPKITSNKPSVFYNVSSWNIPKNINLADPMFNKPSKVDLLIGAEIFFDLLCVGRIHLGDELPKLHKTLLGWIVVGKSKENVTVSPTIYNLSLKCEQPEIDCLNSLLENFWTMETITNKSIFLTDEELKCEQIFNENLKRDPDGRFITKLPFKSSVNELGSSYIAAERRFISLERKLRNDSETKRAYNQFMEEYLSLGHMSLVKESDCGKIKYYAPHQIVLRPDSTSTKLRVVFDCSSKTDSGLSLNDVMMKGPRVQDDLLAIILRFRCYKYALTADVTKMYRQAWVTEDDAYYQAILWRASTDEKIRTYKLRTITYGTTAAPYLATKCLQKLGEDCRKQFSLASSKILSDFYMDDFISGSNDEQEIFEIYRQVSTVLESAKFMLRKWFSNSKTFNDFLPAADKEKTIRLNDEEIIKTLGIVWAPLSDSFCYVWPKLDISRSITKRIVLAELSTLFDPLGLINPIIVKAKIFMQDLWILKVDWDESLPVNLHSQWSDFRENLSGVRKVNIPRFVLSKNKVVRIEMHGFSDASKRAYGCCVYIRSISEDDGVCVHLWTAKSKVAPLKTQSLPRLELLGAELLTKLLVKSKANFPMPIDATYLWTDSEIVLDWLDEHPSHWNIFVANRVSFIQEETKNCTWRHVPSKSNPADIISRGAYVDELTNSFWFTGPPFLKKTCSEWPPNKIRKKNASMDSERNQHAALFVETTSNKDQSEQTSSTVDRKSDVLNWMEKCADFEKLQRIVAQILRIRQHNKSPCEILEEALIRICYCIQQFYFRDELEMLLKNRVLPATSKYKSLSLFVEKTHGVPVLRVGGRLAQSELPYDAKHQILLPNKSDTVRALVRLLHQKNLHAGTQALMAIVRQRFWIVHARGLVRSVTGGCVQCFRCRPKLCSQVMGDLPATRVSVAKPFSTTGVDFCGPVTTTYKLRGCRTTKSYIAVFICFTTKAVHMEVVSDLTAKAFLASLKRFVARRGLCTKLFCDNATNFVGARRELDEMKKQFYDHQVQGKISKYCTANNIEFHHIPPRSPHFGGLWEAAVKSAKYHLARILGKAFLTFEELSTVVAEVEAVLNSRPLTAISNDPNDEQVLTPAHFLVGGPLVGVSEPATDSKEFSHLDRWLRISAIQQHFWKRWSTEYLHELQQKVKWTGAKTNLTEGNIVLVAEDNLPPKQWLMGRVCNVIRDAKGAVRVADIKTKNGEIRRAIHKLAPLPIEN